MSLKPARWSTKRTWRTWAPQPGAAGSVRSIVHIAKQACRRRLTRDVQVRVIADVILLNCALLLALTLHYLWSINVQGGRGSAHEVLSTYVHAYVTSAWPLTVITIALFALSGFYTHGRAYRGRFKALMVAQAVTVSFLAFGCSSYLSGGLLYLPR